MLRRAAAAAAGGAAGRCSSAALAFDAERGELRGPDGTVRLTGGEAALLAALARRAERRALARGHRRDALGIGDTGERAIDVQVTRLRRKIETRPARAALPAHGPRRAATC